MFFTLKSSILVISGYLRTVQVAPGHLVMPCESLGKSLQTCLSQDKSGFPDAAPASAPTSPLKVTLPHLVSLEEFCIRYTVEDEDRARLMKLKVQPGD
jgi:hypothetical protein